MHIKTADPSYFYLQVIRGPHTNTGVSLDRVYTLLQTNLREKLILKNKAVKN